MRGLISASTLIPSKQTFYLLLILICFNVMLSVSSVKGLEYINRLNRKMTCTRYTAIPMQKEIQMQIDKILLTNYSSQFQRLGNNLLTMTNKIFFNKDTV